MDLIKFVAKEKSFYQNALRLQNILKTYDAAKSAADIIEEELMK